MRELESETLSKTHRRSIERRLDTLVDCVSGQDESSLALLAQERQAAWCTR